MSDDGQTEIIDVSAEGTKACRRLDDGLKALDKAIAAVEKSEKPEDKKKVEAAKSLKPKEPSSTGGAHENNKDHADHFFQNLVQSALVRKLYGESPHEEIDKHYNQKYSKPYEEKLKYAKALGITKLKNPDGHDISLGEFAKNAKADIDLAKGAASLIAEGHTKLEVPKSEVPETTAQTKTRIASYIIANANDVRQGKQPQNAIRPDFEKPLPFMPMGPPRQSSRMGQKTAKMIIGPDGAPQASLEVDDNAPEGAEALDENGQLADKNKPVKRVSGASPKLLGAFNPFVVPTLTPGNGAYTL